MWSLAVVPQFWHLRYPGDYTKAETALSSLHRCFNPATQGQASPTPHRPLTLASLMPSKPAPHGKLTHCQGLAAWDSVLAHLDHLWPTLNSWLWITLISHWLGLILWLLLTSSNCLREAQISLPHIQYQTSSPDWVFGYLWSQAYLLCVSLGISYLPGFHNKLFQHLP